jgi:hypothetical protein
VLDALSKFFDTVWNRQTASPRIPVILPVADENLVDALVTGVPAYAKATITRCHVPTNKLRRLPITLERFKLFRLNQLRALQLRHKIPNAAVIKGSPWPIKPPVVEKWDDALVVIDGAHRAYTAQARGEESIEVLLVERVSKPLPAESFSGWDPVEITTAKLDRTARYQAFQAEYFRPIAAALDRVALL